MYMHSCLHIITFCKMIETAFNDVKLIESKNARGGSLTG